MNWLKHLFHVHEWEEIEKFKVDVFNPNGGGLPIYTKYVFIQKCKICSKVRNQVIKY